jgi:glyoxylase-like metal-dependent hydrolase (beta-lactamase superfamily II)
MTVHLAGRPLRLIDTPGHARHHHCVWDERSRGFFSGDTFGLSYRELDTPHGPWLFPTTSPVQFDPPALRASVERLLAQQPECMYLTHYSRVDNVQKLGRDFLEQLDAMLALMSSVAARPHSPDERHEALKDGIAEIYFGRLRAMGSTLPTQRVLEQIGMDIELNAQGMAIWMEAHP